MEKPAMDPMTAPAMAPRERLVEGFLDEDDCKDDVDCCSVLVTDDGLVSSRVEEEEVVEDGKQVPNSL